MNNIKKKYLLILIHNNIYVANHFTGKIYKYSKNNFFLQI